MRPTLRNVLFATTAGLMLSTAAPAALQAEPNHTTSSTAIAAASGTTKSSPASTTAALAALSPAVGTLSHPKALETAVTAYYAYKAAHPDEVTKPYLYFVDMGQSQSAQRGYVFDMQSLTIVEGPFTVAQGSGSGSGVPHRFSNQPRSRATSLGLYVTGNTYAFSGHSNGRPYASVGLRLNGKSNGFNDQALARGVVAHGAPYVTATRAGKSQGCPAMEPARAERLLPKLANGSVVFLFAPDGGWMAQDRWATATANAE